MSAPIGTVERVGSDGRTYFEIVDMGAYVKNAPDNNLTSDEMIDALLEGIAVGRGEQKYRKYLEYSQRYMLVSCGSDLIECLKRGNVSRVVDALWGCGDKDDDASDPAAERTKSDSQALNSIEQPNQTEIPSQPQGATEQSP